MTARIHVWFFLCCCAALAQAAPDEDALGKGQGYPRGRPATSQHDEYLVDTYSGGWAAMFPNRVVKKGAAARMLPKADTPVRFEYHFENRRLNSDDYLERRRVTGLLVAKDGRIVLERYQYGRGDTHRFLSQSMAKSVLALLIGIAIEEGRIASIDDLAQRYVPELEGHPYGDTSIRHLLQMSSGVKFTEEYTGNDDVALLGRASISQRSPGGVATVRPFRQRAAEPGAKFSYSSAESQVLGLVLRGATGVPLADYLSEKIWQPMGAESDANWLVDASGQETAFCCLHATLRDYARLGLLVANDGKLDGRQIVPRDWIRAATQAAEPQGRPGVATPYLGYGYQFWIFPGKRRIALFGVRGQAIFIDPELNLVMVQTAVWKGSRDPEAGRERDALWRGVVAHYGDW